MTLGFAPDGATRRTASASRPETRTPVVDLQIDCLRVVGNVAHMSGITTRSINPVEAPVGEIRRFVVVDNGEGSNSSPDLISTIPVNPARETCENSTLVATRICREARAPA